MADRAIAAATRAGRRGAASRTHLLGAGGIDQDGHAGGLRLQHARTQPRDPVVAPALVVQLRIAAGVRLFDQTGGEQALQGSVSVPGPIFVPPVSRETSSMMA